jgi:very-short-patch-repair endonuclease
MEFKYYVGPRRISKARELRRNQTEAEEVLWAQVRNRQLGGFKIRRQHVINEIIVDFYCVEKKLCIEVDGPYHSAPSVQDADEQRDLDLEFHGHTILRFSNNQVLFDLDTVLAIILAKLKSLPSIGKKPLNHQPRIDRKLLDDTSLPK